MQNLSFKKYEFNDKVLKSFIYIVWWCGSLRVKEIYLVFFLIFLFFLLTVPTLKTKSNNCLISAKLCLSLFLPLQVLSLSSSCNYYTSTLSMIQFVISLWIWQFQSGGFSSLEVQDITTNPISCRSQMAGISHCTLSVSWFRLFWVYMDA